MKKKKKDQFNKKIGIGKYLKKYKMPVFIYVLIHILASLCSIFITVYSAETISFVTKGQAFYKSAISLILVLIGIYVLRRLFYYISGAIYNKYSNKISSELSSDLAKQAFKLTSKTYSNNSTGTFVRRIIDDPIDLVACLSDLVSFVTDVISSLIVVIYITTLNIYFGLIIILALVLLGIFEFFRVKILKRNRKEKYEKEEVVTSITTEIIQSEKDIKSLGLEKKLSDLSTSKFDDYRKSSTKQELTDLKFFFARNTFIEVLTMALLILGIYMLDLGIITFATYMIVYSTSSELRDVVWCFSYILTETTSIKVSSERMFALFNEDEFECEKFGNTSIENVKGDIEFKNVGFTFYEYEEENEDEKTSKRKKKKKKAKVISSSNPVFKDLSFKVPANQTVAFVGKSGCGKSTIFNLMSKMYEVENGEVLIDGVNINDLTKDTLRSSISLVNQFPYIFDMTIKENLLLARKDATDEEIMQAIKDSALDEFVDGLKKGIDTKVGENGIKLSGGQKQRLAIARALLRKTPIILFDESTSSLDNFAQESVKKSIDKLKGQSTVAIVAHRLSTIKNVDKIFFLEEGRITDEGTFDELFKRNKKFNTMFLAENI